MKLLKSVSHCVVFSGSLQLAGCFPAANDDADVYRAALPVEAAVTVAGPESRSSSSADTGAQNATAAPADAPTSKYYAFTRSVRDGVNHVTADVLGSVWYIVNTKPTEVESNTATWGPYTDALEPVTWRFRVTRVTGEEYSYILEGRPKDSTDDADYLAVLEGTGYGQKDTRHGDGEFAIDLDAAKQLDPVAHTDDSGKISVKHDLPASVTREFAPLPRQIEVDLAPSSNGSRLNILSLARQDNTGQLVVDGMADIDESHATALEDVTVVSQWNAFGAGRADVTIAAGDVPAALSPVTAVECWDSHFKQSYYSDSAGIAPEAGSPTACAFTSAAAVE